WSPPPAASRRIRGDPPRTTQRCLGRSSLHPHGRVVRPGTLPLSGRCPRALSRAAKASYRSGAADPAHGSLLAWKIERGEAGCGARRARIDPWVTVSLALPIVRRGEC